MYLKHKEHIAELNRIVNKDTPEADLTDVELALRFRFRNSLEKLHDWGIIHGRDLSFMVQQIEKLRDTDPSKLSVDGGCLQGLHRFMEWYTELRVAEDILTTLVTDKIFILDSEEMNIKYKKDRKKKVDNIVTV